MSKKKSSKKYQVEYAQNLSHELMTPLAIIRSKAEILLQSPNLSKEDLINLDTILRSVERMSRLNKALIILSKLDNDVYVDSKEVSLLEITSEALEKFEDQIRLKKLSIRVFKKNLTTVTTNKNLLDIMVTNLIKNAVLHNHQKGFIEITIDDRSLMIKNSTKKKVPEKIFKRFVSSDEDDSSIGLGLSIVNRICEHLQFKIKHESTPDSFTIKIKL